MATTKKPTTKIFISAHKPTDFTEDDVFAPIQVGVGLSGRKKMPNFLQDNVGDNISELNPRFCELTAQYWAWKNDCNYDYIGFFHYRRYLSFSSKKYSESAWGTVEESFFSNELAEQYGWQSETIKAALKKYDIILPTAKKITSMPNSGKNLREQYLSSGYLHEKDLDIMLGVLAEKYPDYLPYAEAYLNGVSTYLNNMFIMRQDIFKKYSTWLFDILFECNKRIDFSDYSTEAIRTPGHLAERLLNIYIAYLCDHGSYKIKELQTVVILNTDPFPELKPVFSKNNIAIALSANDYYAPYLATTLTSIRNNSTASHNYDIFVMNKDIKDDNKRRMQDIFANYNNFSLRFVDISRFEDKFSRLFLRGHFTIETWFRLLMPEIMPAYDKMLYIDSDLVTNADLAELYKTDIDKYLLAACHDADTAGLYNGFEPNKKQYMDNVLKIKKPYDYFQAGVILFNLKKFRETYSTDEMLKYAASDNWQLLDQDVLNYLAQGRVKFVDMAWNVMFDWRFMRIREIISLAPKYLADEYMEAHKNPKIIHYAGPDKPWNDPSVDYGEMFWKYCKDSGYYEECLLRAARSSGKSSLRQVAKRKIKTGAKLLLPEKTRRGEIARKLFRKIRA